VKAELELARSNAELDKASQKIRELIKEKGLMQRMLYDVRPSTTTFTPASDTWVSPRPGGWDDSWSMGMIASRTVSRTSSRPSSTQ